MATLVRFFKKSYGDEIIPLDFTHESDDFNAAYEEAIRRGHDPRKEIVMKHVDGYNPFSSF